MNRRQLLAVGASTLAGIAGCSSRDNRTDESVNSEPPTTEKSTPLTDETTVTQSSTSIYAVEVEYDDEWQGNISTVNSTWSVEGEGPRTIGVEGTPDVLSANAQKMDDSGEPLTIRLLENGDTLTEATTTSGFGVAQVSEAL